MAITNTQIGGGAFTGRAVYGSGILAGIKEDVSPLVSMISPAETPLLELIGDSLYPAYNVYHEWQEEELGPNAIINSIAVASSTADTVFSVKSSLAAYLQKGMIMRGPEVSGGEYMQILVVADPTITVSRAFGGTTANSFGVGEYLTIVADAAVDGADVLADISRPRPRSGNYTQNFKKDVIVSGTMQAVNQHGGVTDELDTQIQRRLREAMRDLEKNVILGILSGNTIGSSSAVRTMKGVLSFLATNSIVVSSMGTDFGSTTMIFFEDQVNTALKAAWLNGGTDLNVIVCGAEVKRRFDQLNNQRVRVSNDERQFVNQMVTYENTYGVYRVIIDRWMPVHMMVGLATSRMAIVPMNGRSFHYEPVAKTGDAQKGMVLGEYTNELRNEAGMCKLTFTPLAPATLQRLIQAP